MPCGHFIPAYLVLLYVHIASSPFRMIRLAGLELSPTVCGKNTANNSPYGDILPFLLGKE